MIRPMTYILLIVVMDPQLQKLLLFGGLIGVGYLAFNKYTEHALPLNLTRKLVQEIKHQVLIVAINYAEGCKTHLEKLKQSEASKIEELTGFFRGKLAQIYEQKQMLILNKYSVQKSTFEKSLIKHGNDPKVKKNIEEIFDMMERAVQGQLPDFTVDKRAASAKTKHEIREIYEEMSKMIIVSLVTKLKQEKIDNPSFDPNDDTNFKKAIRDLNIYDKKIEFFKTQGFKEQWGCPNENFFKISEGLKAKDAGFKQQMVRLQKIYEKAIDIAAIDPESMTIQKIHELYQKKQPEVVVAPVKKVTANNVGRSAIRHSNIAAHIQVAKEQKKQKQKEKAPKVFVPEPVAVVNLNQSTRSEPEEHTGQIFESIITEVPQSEVLQKIQSVPAEIHVLPEVKEAKKEVEVNHQTIDEVPSDALQLEIQMKEQAKAAQEEQKNEHEKQEEEKAESNVSVNGDSIKHESLDLKNENQEHKQDQTLPTEPEHKVDEADKLIEDKKEVEAEHEVHEN